MSLHVHAAFAAVALLMLLPETRAAAPVPPNAGKSVTFPYPAKAPIVLQINGIGTARERLTAMLKTALPNDIATLNKQVDDAFKQLLADRKLTAIPKDGRVFVVVNNIESLIENAPAVSLLLPVTSYKEFRATFLTADERKTFEAGKSGVDEAKVNLLGSEHAVYLVDLKEYVAITPDKGTAETYSIKYTKATTAAMPPELARSFVSADVSVYVNFDVVNDLYGEQIRAFKGLIDFGIQQGLMGGMVPGINKQQIEAVKMMLKGVFQGVEDCRGLVLAVEFRPEGLNLRLQGTFAEDTASFHLLKSEKPGTLADLGKLPAGLGQYTGAKYGKKIAETIRGLNPEFAPADEDEKSTGMLEKRTKELLAAGPQGEVSASGTATLGLTISHYTDPKKAATALVGRYQAMNAGGRIQSVVLKDAPKVTLGAKKLGDFTFAEIRLAFDFEATVKDLPEGLKDNTLAQIKRLVSEKMTVWIGTDGKTVAQVTAKDWDAASSELNRYFEEKKPVGDTTGYKLTRKNLPSEASLLMMLETEQTVTMLLESLRAMEGTVPGIPKIGKVKPLKGAPTFIGVAVTLKGDTATGNLFVPATAIAAGHTLLADLFRTVD
jgi:hypothetical protein